MTTPQTYTLRFTPKDELPYRVLMLARRWLEENNRLAHLVAAYDECIFESVTDRNGEPWDFRIPGDAVIVLNNRDTAMLLKLSLITD